jgi:hypothetical protein
MYYKTVFGAKVLFHEKSDMQKYTKNKCTVRFVTSPCHPNRFWGPSGLLSNGNQGHFPWRWNSQGVKLTTHFQLGLWSRYVNLYTPCPICLHGIVLKGQLNNAFKICSLTISCAKYVNCMFIDRSYTQVKWNYTIFLTYFYLP